MLARPILETLAGIRDNNNGTLLISARGQYCPDWRIKLRDGALARRVTTVEVETVRRKAGMLGLRLVNF